MVDFGKYVGAIHAVSQPARAASRRELPLPELKGFAKWLFVDKFSQCASV